MKVFNIAPTGNQILYPPCPRLLRLVSHVLRSSAVDEFAPFGWGFDWVSAVSRVPLGGSGCLPWLWGVAKRSQKHSSVHPGPSTPSFLTGMGNASFLTGMGNEGSGCMRCAREIHMMTQLMCHNSTVTCKVL